MTDKQTEALKLALEAIEACLSAGTEAEDQDASDKLCDARAAIREALAEQPAQQPIHCKDKRENGGVCPHHNLQCGWPKCNEPEQPAQQQEWVERERAVGYREGHQNALRQMAAQQQEPAAVVDLRNANYVRWLEGVAYPLEGTELYTSPQPSKPLTDEQIMEMYNEPRSDAEMLEFARAIEAAHGIGEQK